MNTANWIPDLFMQRVMDNAEWTLFSPVDVPDLHEKFGTEFAAAYTAYEALADAGRLKLHKSVHPTSGRDNMRYREIDNGRRIYWGK